MFIYTFIQYLHVYTYIYMVLFSDHRSYKASCKLREGLHEDLAYCFIYSHLAPSLARSFIR